MNRLTAWLEYRLLLPLATMLPYPLAQRINRLRAHWMVSRRGEWRFFLEGIAPHERRMHAISEINAFKNANLTLQSLYTQWCYEEYNATRLYRMKHPKIEFSGPFPKSQSILISAHYGFFSALTCYAELMQKSTAAIGSDVIFMPKIPESIQIFYKKKYAALENGSNGPVIYQEKEPEKIITALKTGLNLVVITDLPPKKESVPITLFGKKRGWSAGAARLAARYQLPIVPYIVTPSQKSWHIQFFEAVEGKNTLDFQPAYQVLANQIESNPELWWAADLLPLYPSFE